MTKMQTLRTEAAVAAREFVSARRVAADGFDHGTTFIEAREQWRGRLLGLCTAIAIHTGVPIGDRDRTIPFDPRDGHDHIAELAAEFVNDAETIDPHYGARGI